MNTTLQPLSTQLLSNLLLLLNTLQTSGISPKSSRPISDYKQGSVSRHRADAHTAQLVQPQGLTSGRKADEKKLPKGVVYHNQNNLNLNKIYCQEDMIILTL